MSSEELVPIILKYVGGTIAAFYGLYATLTEFRVEKEGKKVLTTKGYIGIVLLVCSSLLALTTNAVTDVNENKKKLKEANDRLEAAKVEEQQRNESKERDLQSLQSLDEQLGVSETTANQLQTASKEIKDNSAKTQKVSDNLFTQLDITKGISNGLFTQLDISKNNSSVLTQAVSTLKENTQTSRTIFNQTNRLMNPLRDVQILYFLNIPLSANSEVKKYRDRLEKSVRDILPQLKENAFSIPGIYVQEFSGNDPKLIRFDNRTKLFPSYLGELVSYEVLTRSGLSLQIYKNPIDPIEHPEIKKNSNKKADLHIQINARTDVPLLYKVKSHQIIFYSGTVESDPRNWVTNRKITSVPDLAGSQLFISLRPSRTVVYGQPIMDLIEESRKEDIFELLQINVYGTRLVIRQENVKQYRTFDGYPIYVFEFPQNLEELDYDTDDY